MSEEQDDYLEDNTDSIGILWVKIGLFIWGLGIALSLITAGGFGIYYVLFLILGAVCLITCPCIGAGIIGGTIGLWALMLTYAVGILMYTSAIASIFGILSPITLIARSSRNIETITIVSIYFLVHLLVGYYIDDIGVYEIVFNPNLPTPEEIQNLLNNILNKDIF
jgi:hypothetical protein